MLINVAKFFLESPMLQFKLNKTWIKNSTAKTVVDAKLTDLERKLIIKVVNPLMGIVPKHVVIEGESGTRAHLSHVALRLPVVALATHILCHQGKQSQVLAMTPEISTGARYTLPLSPPALYEALAGQQENRFCAKQADGITDFTAYAQTTRSRDDRLAMVKSFFDLDKVQHLADNFHCQVLPR